MLNEHLTWKAHANMITIKLSKVVGIINKLKYVYPEAALMTVFFTVLIAHKLWTLAMGYRYSKSISITKENDSYYNR